MAPTHNAARTPSYSVVVAAAGIGSRMGGGQGAGKKPFLAVCGRPILDHALERLRAAAGCGQIVVVLHPDECADEALAGDLRERHGVSAIACGGRARQQSVLAGLELTPEEPNLVLIHDAVRPLTEPEVIARVACAAHECGAAIAAVPATDTVKVAGEGDVIVDTPDRARLWFAHTPQGFHRDLILRAHRAARDDGFLGTDDAKLVERLGLPVQLVADTRDNLKVTTPEDLAVAEAILRWRDAAGD